MQYRDPFTGRFITESQWETLNADYVDEFDDYEDLDEWEGFDEDEVY